MCVRMRLAGGEQVQPTNSQLSSRIYSRVILAEPRSRNFAPCAARPPRTRVMTSFLQRAALKIAPRARARARACMYTVLALFPLARLAALARPLF